MLIERREKISKLNFDNFFNVDEAKCKQTSQGLKKVSFQFEEEQKEVKIQNLTFVWHQV